MRNRITATLLLILTIILPLNAAEGSNPPRLVLVVIIDQMRRDYLDRFDDLYGVGGFRLLEQKGARFANCSYPYSVTYTGPGHSAILSGIPPSKSGIIGNDWYSLRLSRTYYCAEDSTMTAVGIAPSSAAGKMSPANFNGNSVCDMLLQSSPQSKALGIALKDRGAILPAGKHPTGAFWFDVGSGRWISSSYYGRELPHWATEFNNKRMAEGLLGKDWRKFLADDAYIRQGPDSGPGEGALPGEKTSLFPHRVLDPAHSDDPVFRGKCRRFEPLVCTPYGNDMTVAFAEAAITGERLGRRGVPDILSVSFSSPDWCGHLFGPQSQEMEDMMLRLDRQLAAFFSFVDSTVGLQNVDIVLTADHGVAPLPEQTAALGGIRMLAGDYLLDIKVHMGQKYGYNEGNDNIVRGILAGGLWVDTLGIAAHHFPVQEYMTEAARFTESLPGIARCSMRSEIEAMPPDIGDSVLSRVKRSYNLERGAQIMVVQKPYCIFGDKDVAVHGSPYSYDCDVPLLFFGKDFRQGTYDANVTPLDIAPTLARVLRVMPPPGCEGMPLTECLGK